MKPGNLVYQGIAQMGFSPAEVAGEKLLARAAITRFADAFPAAARMAGLGE